MTDKLEQEVKQMKETIASEVSEKEFWKKKAESPKIVYQEKEVIAQKCEKCVKDNFHKAKREYDNKAKKLEKKEKSIDDRISQRMKILNKEFEAFKVGYRLLAYLGIAYWVVRVIIDLWIDAAFLQSVVDYIDVMEKYLKIQNSETVFLIAWSLFTVLALWYVLNVFNDIFTYGYLILITTLLTALGSEMKAFIEMNLLAFGSLTIIAFFIFRIGFRKWLKS